MMELAKKIIGPALDRFDEYFNEALSSDVPLLHRILRYINGHKGKQMRPMFVLLSARLGGHINEHSYHAALLAELLHTASLVHDDLVDDALERRGTLSVNALWKNKIAVLTGDYLFTKGLLLSLSHNAHGVLKIYSDAIRQMSEGELLQLWKSRRLNLQENIYYDIIHAKTASFLAAACAAGASTTFSDPALVERMHLFGEKAGMAFQLKDDLFDYGTADVGKPTGNDIREKKMTLPLIYTLNSCNAPLRKKIINIVKRHNTNAEKVNFVIAEVHKAGGIQYAADKMLRFRNEALDILHGFPASDARCALEELVRYITDRAY